MPRFGVVVAVLGGALALIALTFALFPNGGGTPVSAAGEPASGTATITVESSNGEVAWGRLRWLLAGLSISAVVLVGARQVMVAAAPKRVRHASRRPVMTRPETAYEPPTSVWIPDASQVSIGD